VKLAPPYALVTAVKDRERERILQQAPEWRLMIIAVDADHPHQIGDYANRGFGATDLRLDSKFIGRWRLRVESVARTPAEIACSSMAVRAASILPLRTAARSSPVPTDGGLIVPNFGNCDGWMGLARCRCRRPER
jgi:hypothetical protein